MKLHSYPWYTDDWYGKETWLSMNCEERGIYRELLDHCYQEGSLPASPSVLQRRAGASDEEWERSSAKPLSCFTETEGRLTHRKVEEVRAKALKYKEIRRESGSRGGKAKALTQLEPSASKPPSKTLADLEFCHEDATSKALAKSYPSSSSTSTITSTSRAGSEAPGLGAYAQSFIGAYPKRTGLQLGTQTYLSIVNPDEAPNVLAGLERWKRSEAWTKDNGKFIPEPGRWLSDRRWEEYPAPAQPTGGYETPPFKESF